VRSSAGEKINRTALKNVLFAAFQGLFLFWLCNLGLVFLVCF